MVIKYGGPGFTDTNERKWDVLNFQDNMLGLVTYVENYKYLGAG